MRINNNIMALNAHRQLGVNQANSSKSMDRLSSGMRINRAGDDAAGLAISEKMRGQIRGLKQASRNAQDGISLIQTAEGNLNETHAILQRMRELAVQASNDTVTAQDRANIQDEINQLSEEIDKIAQRAEFNTKKLLDGSMGKRVDKDVANVHSNSSLGTISAENAVDIGDNTELTALTDSAGNSLGIAEGDTIEISYIKNGETKTVTVTVGTTVGTEVSKLSELTGAITGGGDITATVESGKLVFTAKEAGYAKAIHGVTITVKGKDNVVKTAASNALSAFEETKAAKDVRLDGTATFQIGANTGQHLTLDIEDMTAAALGVANLKVETQSQANVAIKVLDTATQKVSAERSKLGATQNRLEHTIANLGTSAENLQAAESRIRDLDMAEEIMAFTKNNILQQAATAMLAQANMAPQSVLQLLG